VAGVVQAAGPKGLQVAVTDPATRESGGPAPSDHRARVGFHVSAFGSHQVLAALTGVSKCGFHGLEIFADTSQVFADRPEEFKSIFEIAGIQFAGVHGGGLLTSEEYRAAEMAEWRRLVEWVGAAGGEYAVFRGGEAHDGSADVTAQAASFLDELGQHAFAHGVTLCYEPDRDCPFATKEAVSALMAQTDPRWVSLSLDTAHLAEMRVDPTLFLLSQKQRLVVVHLRDMRDPADPLAVESPYTDLGKGVLDLQAVAGALHASSFGGWIVGAVDKPDVSAFESVEAAAAYMRLVLELDF
jgi:sugar phosphate isomerase/epimerase